MQIRDADVHAKRRWHAAELKLSTALRLGSLITLFELGGTPWDYLHSLLLNKNVARQNGQWWIAMRPAKWPAATLQLDQRHEEPLTMVMNPCITMLSATPFC